MIMQAEPLIEWQEPITEFIGFIAAFLAVGAVGFRYAALRGRVGHRHEDRDFYNDASARAATMGLVGAVVSALLFARNLPNIASRAHTTVSGALTGNAVVGLQFVLIIVGLIGLALAASRKKIGWPLAAVGVILAPLTGVIDLKWTRMVNPVHKLVAGLWLGTLFVLVVAGIGRVLRDDSTRDRRGAITADMVNSFSPLALTCGMLLVLSGVITGWRHLNPLSSLWTTPYGYALIVKLIIVAIVFALGAWNWRRQRPTLGTEDAALALRRSAKGELVAAVLVLTVTAILVSLPSPKPPGAAKPGGPPPAGAPSGGG